MSTPKENGRELVMKALQIKNDVGQHGTVVLCFFMCSSTYSSMVHYITGTFNTVSDYNLTFVNVYGIPLVIKEQVKEDVLLPLTLQELKFIMRRRR